MVSAALFATGCSALSPTCWLFGAARSHPPAGSLALPPGGLYAWNHRTGFVPHALFLTIWWHQQLDALHLGVGHRSFAEITRIRSRVLRLPAHVLCHLFQHRQQLLLVIGILRHRRRDDLRMTVYR